MTIRISIKPIREHDRGVVSRLVLDCVAHHISAQSQKGRVLTIHIINAFQPQNNTERNRVWKALKYLQEQNRLLIEEVAGERFVTLTKDGYRALEALRITQLSPSTPKKWDGKWRLVMFDIPLTHEGARLPMKQKLLDFGFEPYQKSVFIHAHDFSKEVLQVAKYLGVEGFVRFVEAQNISAVDEFKKIFDV